ncbi:MAG: hypothetical protein ACN4EH_02900, partial [Methyloceanibacter sp.]
MKAMRPPAALGGGGAPRSTSPTCQAGDDLHGQYPTGNSEPTGITFNEADGFFYITNDDAKTITRYN